MHRGRKKVESSATAQRILAAAERIFAAHGLAGARTEEIARAAHVNKAMLHYYFGSKERLHRAVFKNLFGHAQRLIEAEKLPDASRKQLILAFVDGYFKFRTLYPNYARLMQQLMMESPEQFEWLAREYFREGHKQLASVIRKGIACGEFRRVDPGHTVINIIAMIVFYFSGAPVHSVLLGRDALQPRAVAEHKRAVIDLLEHGLFRTPARSR
ncbi:MAG TPA: TetR/AcrR family transcriptional regulator [Candidatus Limnocylindrales bacterium]|nr:TetR/AcrR family transcriptional regulator [Candidatus Limnocylindrales bacterium]